MPHRARSKTKDIVAKLESNLKPAEFRLSRFKSPKFNATNLPTLIKAKAGQCVGKLRRFALHAVNEEYVAKMARYRLGECLRCGLCCKLLFECPFLQNLPDGTGRCRIHGRKPDNCAFFPIDERDLRERDSLGAKTPCGYRFRQD